MSGGQIDIDVNGFEYFILNLELDVLVVIYININLLTSLLS